MYYAWLRYVLHCKCLLTVQHDSRTIIKDGKKIGIEEQSRKKIKGREIEDLVKISLETLKNDYFWALTWHDSDEVASLQEHTHSYEVMIKALYGDEVACYEVML